MFVTEFVTYIYKDKFDINKFCPFNLEMKKKSLSKITKTVIFMTAARFFYFITILFDLNFGRFLYKYLRGCTSKAFVYQPPTSERSITLEVTDR